MEAIGFDPRNTAFYGGGAVMNECCLTQDANQHKWAKCVVVRLDSRSTADSASRRLTNVANVKWLARRQVITERL